jgi:ABC-type multidrug transport system ATPase subunit
LTSTAISVTGLHKTFGDVVALAEVSFSVADGTALGLLGPNGSGKTTAVSILSTALRADAGQASVCGFDVSTQGAAVRHPRLSAHGPMSEMRSSS